MPVPPLPPEFESLGRRSFSFYPPIVGIERNDWILRKATWSDILVSNSRSGEEILIPRGVLGELSEIDEPIAIVGLLKELEYNEGQVMPRRRRVIEIPRAVNDGFRAMPRMSPPRSHPAPVIGIRLDTPGELRVGKLVTAMVVVGVFGCAVLVNAFRAGRDSWHTGYMPAVEAGLGLSAQADYPAVVRKLGTPTREVQRTSEVLGDPFWVLSYPAKGVSVILKGGNRETARYIGAVDGNWLPVDVVGLPSGGNTRSLLGSLKPN